jgi:hypothetical protein
VNAFANKVILLCSSKVAKAKCTLPSHYTDSQEDIDFVNKHGVKAAVLDRLIFMYAKESEELKRGVFVQIEGQLYFLVHLIYMSPGDILGEIQISTILIYFPIQIEFLISSTIHVAREELFGFSTAVNNLVAPCHYCLTTSKEDLQRTKYSEVLREQFEQIKATLALPKNAPTINSLKDLFAYSPSLFAEAIGNYRTLHELAIPPQKKRLNFEHIGASLGKSTRKSDMEKLFNLNGNKG